MPLFYVYDWSARCHARDAKGMLIYRANKELAQDDAARFSKEKNHTAFVTTTAPSAVGPVVVA